MDRAAVVLVVVSSIFALVADGFGQGPPVALSIRPAKDCFRANDEFSIVIGASNPGGERRADLYVWLTRPDLKSFYMPDWVESRRPWLSGVTITAGFAVGPVVIYQARLPDFRLPVWQPGRYQLSAQLLDSDTGEPLGPFAMSTFEFKHGQARVIASNNNYVLDIAPYQGDVWAGGVRSLTRWHESSGSWSWSCYSRFEGPSDNEALGLYVDRFGNLLIWPYWGQGITVFDGLSFQPLFKDTKLGVLAIVTDRDETIWAAGSEGVFSVNKAGEIRWCGESDGFPEDYDAQSMDLNSQGYPVVLIFGGGQGKSYLATYEGQSQSWEMIPVRFDIASRTSRITVDIHDHIWFATRRGAVEFDGVTYATYDHTNSGLPSDNVYRIKVDATGRLWFCCLPDYSGSGGLCYFDGENWGQLPGFDATDVTDIEIGFDGTVYAGRRSGVTVQSPGGVPVVLRTDWPEFSQPQRGIAWGPDGRMYVPDRQKGLWSFDGMGWSLVREGEDQLVPPASVVAFDSKGVGWIGWDGGVIRWEGDEFTRFGASEGLAPGSVIALKIDQHDRVWCIVQGQFGAGGAVCSFDGSSWHNHASEPGAPAAPLLLDIDSRGWVWVSNETMRDRKRVFGLFSYDGQSWRQWGEQEGLSGFEFGEGGVVCDGSGEVVVSCRDAQTGEPLTAVYDGERWEYYPMEIPFSHGVVDSSGRVWLASDHQGLAVWQVGGRVEYLRQEWGDVSSNTLGLCGPSPEGDMYAIARLSDSLEWYLLNPNVVAVANKTVVAPGDTLSVALWADNPGGSDRLVDVWVEVALPGGQTLYWPEFSTSPAPGATVTLPKQTAFSPVEVLHFTVPENIPTGLYTITPWFCEHGSTRPIGRETAVTITVVGSPG